MNPYALRVDGLDPRALMVTSLRGKEAMSSTYSFKVAVTADATSGNLESAVLGQRATMTWQVGETERAFHGLISRVALGRSTDRARVELRMTFVPRLWLLTQQRRTRIFQDMRVPDIVTKVLLDAGIAARWQLVHPYPVRAYCTQYEETDYAFLTRILAEAGIFFRFHQGPVADEGYLTASTVVAAAAQVAVTATGALGVGQVGVSVGGSVVGTIGGAITSIASVASPLLPGDTLIFGDDAAFYPPLGDDDAMALLGTTLASAAVGAVGIGVAGVVGSQGGMPPGVDAAVGFATGAAGAAIGAAFAQPPPSLRFVWMRDEATLHTDAVTDLDLRSTVRPTRAVVRDYDPARPTAKLEDAALSVAPFSASALETLAAIATKAGSIGSAVPGIGGDIAANVASHAGAAASALAGVLGEATPPLLEVYDHHAPFLFPDWTTNSDEASRLLRHERRRAVVGRGRSGAPHLGSGHAFTLVDHPNEQLNRAYVVTSVEHHGRSAPPAAQRDGDGGGGGRYQVYSNRFECAPSSVPYLPAKPPRFSVQVVLTAVVIGQDIDVDPMGRIRVRFHWDREEKSSCWIRTMQSWAGAGWGGQFIPRAGMEVVVAFEGGDPDKPLVMGTVYNATHPSPFPLPADKTRSGFRTQSSPVHGGFNELSFQDASGSEQIYLRAQKDLAEEVTHDHHLHVGRDEVIRIDGNRTDAVRGNVDERVTGALTTRIEARERRDVQGQADLVYADDLLVRVLGSSTTIVGKGDKKRSWTTHAEGTAALSGLDRLELSSETEIVLSVGDSAIRITQGGIELSGALLTSRTEGARLEMSKDGHVMKTADTSFTMGDKLVLKSPTASMVVGQNVQADAPKILLNSPEQATDTPPEEPPPPTTIELKDQDGNAVPLQRFVAKIDDGSEVSGKTDKDGKAKLEIATGGTIVFDLLLDGEPAPTDLLPYLVKQGDHLDRLAFRFGFDAEKVWNHGKNAELKAKRQDPSLLCPGDVLHLPRGRRTGMTLSQGTDNAYTANVPKTEATIVFGEDRFFNAKFTVEGFGAPFEGTTDGAGNAELDVPVHVREATLTFVESGVDYTLMFGDLDPIDEETGVRHRLRNLRFLAANLYGGEAEQAAAVSRAIAAFQATHGMPVTGELDDATRDRLKQEHDA